MENIIDIKDIIWKRNGENILDGVNWQVKKGEHWALLGLNGSGKTTLLNMLNGYIWPTKGTLTILGKTFGKTDLRELRKSIGWVSSSLQSRIKGTEIGLDIVMSGKYASIGLHEETTQADHLKAINLMQKLGCGDLKFRVYETCSQGEKQKILIARGLMADPALLVLDEPTNGLDFIAREDLMVAIDGLARQTDAPTILFVTHHIEEILPIFSHTLLLRDGKVFDQGENKDVLTSARLSQFFGRDIEATLHNERVWLTLKN